MFGLPGYKTGGSARPGAATCILSWSWGLELFPSLADVVHRAVQARGGLHLVPARLVCALGEADHPAFLEAPLPHPGYLEDGLVVDLSGHLPLPDVVPVPELGFQVALGVELAGVDQVGDE